MIAALRIRVALVIAAMCATLTGGEVAQAGCGHVRRPPAEGRIGTAPLAIGDSVMYGAAWRLAHFGFESDALCGRSPRGGLYLLRRRKRRGTLPEIVVVALGTNYFITDRQIAAMLRVLGRRRTLMLVTPFRSWRPVNNAPMRRAARRWPRRTVLIDWSRPASRHPEWFWADGTHMRPRALNSYRRLLQRAAWSRQRGRIVWK
jgi:hypothetical protein